MLMKNYRNEIVEVNKLEILETLSSMQDDNIV